MENKTFDVNSMLKNVYKKQKVNKYLFWYRKYKNMYKQAYTMFKETYFIKKYVGNDQTYDAFVSEYVENVKNDFIQNKQIKNEELDEFLFDISNDIILKYNLGSTSKYQNRILKSDTRKSIRLYELFLLKIRALFYTIKLFVNHRSKIRRRKREFTEIELRCKQAFPRLGNSIILRLAYCVQLNNKVNI